MRWALVSLALVCVACATHPPQPAKPASPAGITRDWEGYVARFIEAYLASHPSFAAGQGRHEYDGQLPDWSADGIARLVGWLDRERAELRAWPASALSAEQRFERDYVVSLVDAELFWLNDARAPFLNPAFYFDRGLDPHTYVNVPYAPVEQRALAFTRYANAIPNALAQMRANLKTPMPRSFVYYAKTGVKGFIDFYRDDVPRAFASVADEQKRAELSAALARAGAAMNELGGWLASQTEYDDRAQALGAERFGRMLLLTERVDTPLAELEALGKADLERNLATLASACARYLPGGTIEACVKKQADHKPEGGPVEGARKQLADIKRYVVDHGIVSIPSSEDVQVEEAPGYMRQNFAYIQIPGCYERNLPSIYYIAPPDPSWPKAEQDAYIPGKADLLFTSVHEVWPGHYLQFLHAHRSPWRFGQLFIGYAFAEGWAHYAEELMIEEGLGRDDPELHIGQLLNALLRNVRYLCAIGLHTKGMSVEECEQMFKEKAYQDPGNARQQAARGTYDPGYLNYTLGKLMIQKLRGRWEAEHEGHSRREFHDLFLSFGGPPIPLVAERMMAR